MQFFYYWPWEIWVGNSGDCWSGWWIVDATDFEQGCLAAEAASSAVGRQAGRQATKLATKQAGDSDFE